MLQLASTIQATTQCGFHKWILFPFFSDCGTYTNVYFCMCCFLGILMIKCRCNSAKNATIHMCIFLHVLFSWNFDYKMQMQFSKTTQSMHVECDNRYDVRAVSTKYLIILVQSANFFGHKILEKFFEEIIVFSAIKK